MHLVHTLMHMIHFKIIYIFIDSLRSNQVFSHVGTFSWVVICPHERGRWDCFPHVRGFGK